MYVCHLSHLCTLLKPLYRKICLLAGTIVRRVPSNTALDGPWSPTEGEIWGVGTRSLQWYRLLPVYFGPCSVLVHGRLDLTKLIFETVAAGVLRRMLLQSLNQQHQCNFFWALCTRTHIKLNKTKKCNVTPGWMTILCHSHLNVRDDNPLALCTGHMTCVNPLNFYSGNSHKFKSELVGFNSTPTQFRSLALSLIRKAGTESPTVKESLHYINLANAI